MRKRYYESMSDPSAKQVSKQCGLRRERQRRYNFENLAVAVRLRVPTFRAFLFDA
jgi:hypothetical protein